MKDMIFPKGSKEVYKSNFRQYGQLKSKVEKSDQQKKDAIARVFFNDSYHVVQQKIARRCGKSRFLSGNAQSVRFEALLETSYVFLSKMGRKGKWMNDKATDSSNMTGDHETIRCSQTRMFLLRLPSLFSGVIARSLGTQACVGLQFDLG